jgi:hypothetical protein
MMVDSHGFSQDDTQIIEGIHAHSRTMMMHQEWQLRDSARAELAQRNPVASRTGIHASAVVRARKNGDFQIEAFTNLETGVGTWFSALNFSPCREGDTVLYTYVDEIPICLGRMPAPTLPWMIPNASFQDTVYFEEFDFGGGALGTYGLYRWTGAVAGTGSISQGPGDANTPGLMIIVAGTTIGAYAYIHPSSGAGSGLPIESIDSVGWKVWNVNAGNGGTAATNQIFVGIVDSGASLTNYVCFLQNNFSNGNWSFQIVNASVVTASVDTGIPCIDGHIYRFMIKRVGPGQWAGYIWDVTDNIDAVALGRGANTTSLAMFPYVRHYPLVATTARTIYVDYVWWARRGLNR